jgi:hypothetical protein
VRNVYYFNSGSFGISNNSICTLYIYNIFSIIEQNCSMHSYAKTFILQVTSYHRLQRNASFNDDTKYPKLDGPPLLGYFRMIRDFILDPMHLIDGGVLKDFIQLICARLESFLPGMTPGEKAKLRCNIRAWINVFNKTTILEICKFR